MHMLHRNIDQLFSLTPSRLGNCLSVFLLFKLTTFWQSSSYQQWKPQQNNDERQWCPYWSEEVAPQINVFIEHSEDGKYIALEAYLDLILLSECNIESRVCIFYLDFLLKSNSKAKFTILGYMFIIFFVESKKRKSIPLSCLWAKYKATALRRLA